MGGLKAPHLTKNVRLDPPTVDLAVGVYRSMVACWNEWLRSRGEKRVALICPVGSSYYYQDDLNHNNDVTYGDIDYLVSLPLDVPAGASPAEERNLEDEILKRYTRLMEDFIKSGELPADTLDAEATLVGNPFLSILNIPGHRHVQVDTIVTYPTYVLSGWMPGRWIPPRGLKGYISGQLYSTLGDVLCMSISDRGILAKVKDGTRVPFSTRKGVELVRVGRDVRTMFGDILRHCAGDSVMMDDHMMEKPGIDPADVDFDDIAMGVASVVSTLMRSGHLADEWTERVIIDTYKARLEDAVQKKVDRGLSARQAFIHREIHKKVVTHVRNCVHNACRYKR